jgi:Co/Zn/Cd efflux system component
MTMIIPARDCGQHKPAGPRTSYDQAVSRTQRLAVVLLLNLGLVTALVAVGLAAHSLAVFAAGRTMSRMTR